MSNFDDCWYKDVCTKQCTGSCIRYLEMKYLMDNSNLPVSLQTPVVLRPSKCDVDAFMHLADIKDDIKNFIQSGNNLYITSKTTGNGKTSWSIKLLLKYFDTVWPGNGFKVRGVFVHVPTFLLQCKDFDSHDGEWEIFKYNLLNVDVVIWDDIASTGLSNYDFSQLIMYIDSRYSAKKSNIYTGNIPTRDELERALGNKLTSRIFSSRTTCITLNGGDRR